MDVVNFLFFILVDFLVDMCVSFWVMVGLFFLVSVFGNRKKSIMMMIIL